MLSRECLPAAVHDLGAALGDLDTEVKLPLMKNTPSLLSAALMAALLQLAPAASVNAQSKAVAPKAGDKLMTKDELRACMKLQQGNSARKDDIEKRRLALREERSQLAQPDAAFTQARARVDAQLERVKQADAAVKSHAVQVEDWTARMTEFEANSKEMRNADRRRIVLRQERADLQAAGQGLTEARAEQVKIYEALVKAANDLRGNQGDRAAEWNKRNDALTDEEDALIDARSTYSADCANRRFREDDEAAIKAGK